MMGVLDSAREQVAQHIAVVREYERITGFWQIARRALANNSFDGVLTMVGVLTGNYLGGIRDAATVIRIGIAASVSIGVSGLWGAYLAESAERGRELAQLERVSLIDLSDTKFSRAARVAVVVVALVDGISPLVSSLIVLLPFFIAPLIGNILLSYAFSLLVGLISLFGLGMFLGHISERSLVGYGLRTVIAGIVAVAINFLLPNGPTNGP
jgi:predicted membrane protein (TIGR00267 family)